MLELGFGADLVRGAGWIVRILFFALLGLALWRGKTWQRKIIYALLVVGVFFGPLLPSAYQTWQHKQRYAKAKAIFDERCKTAGEKIYRTVENVEGVLLLNVPPTASQTDLHNPNWPDAGLPQQHGASSYIGYFLSWIDPADVFTGKPEPGDRPGYRFVDAKDRLGLLWRYTLKKNGEQGIGEPGFPDLIKTEQKGALAHYAVSYANLINFEDRENWVAGTSVTVSDTQTGEILATSTWYSLEPGLGSKAGHRMPWRFAVSCPNLRAHRAMAPVRFFVERVLEPKQRELNGK